MSNASAPRKVVLVALLFASVASAQSTYQGATAEEWIARFEKNDPAAAEALVAMGPEDVPAILRVEESTRRAALISVLARMGSQARDPVPMLVALAQESNEWGQGAAVEALGRISVGDEAVVAALLVALEDKEGPIREKAAQALGRLGPDARTAVPALLRALDDYDYRVPGMDMGDEDYPVVEAAALAVARVDPESVEVRDRMAARISFGWEYRRAILLMGEAAPSVVELALLTGDGFAAQQVPQLVRDIGPIAVPALIRVLRDPSARHREDTIEALGVIGAPAFAAVPELLDALRDGQLRRSAIDALRKIEPDPADALRAATICLPTQDARHTALELLADLGPQARPAIPALLELLEDEDQYVREKTAQVLGAIGPDARAAIPKLLPLLLDARTTSEASRALLRIGAKGKGIAEGLAPLLHDEDDWIRHAALRVLARMGRDGANVLARSLPTAKDRSDILKVLARMDDCPAEVIVTLAHGAAAPAQPEAWDRPSSLLNSLEEGSIPKLAPMLKSSKLEDARDAAAVLAGVADRSPAAHKLLVSVVDHKDAEIRKRAIGTLDLSTPEEFALWRELLGDSDASVRQAAWTMGERSKSSSQELIQALWESSINPGAETGDVHLLAVRVPDEVASPRERAEAVLHAARRAAAVRRARSESPPSPLDSTLRWAESGDLLARTVANDPEAIAVLVAALGDPDERVRLWVANALGLIGPAAKEAAGPLTEMTLNLEGLDRCHVLIALARIQADPAVVGPMLAEVWKEPKLRLGARTGLLALGRAGVPWIEPLLFDAQVAGREEAILDLRVLFPVAPEAIELVARGLKETDPRVQHRAAWVLQIDPRIVPGSKDLHAEPFASEEEKDRVRRMIASSPTAVAALCAHVADPYSTMSEEAAVTLAQLAPEANAALPTLAQALRHGNPRVVEPASQGIVRFGAAGAQAITGLLADPDPLRRLQGADLLGTIGAAAGDVAANLVPLLSDQDARVRDRAIVAYARIGRPSPDAVPALVRAIEEASGEVLDAALEALVILGPAAEAAAPTLAAKLDRGDPRIRLLSLTTQCRVAPDGAETLERLRRGVADPDPGFRRAAWDALLSREGGLTKTLGALTEALQDPEILRRAAAIESLGRAGADARPQADTVSVALAHGPLPVRRAAARALGLLGGDAASAQESLLAALSDPDAQVRMEASRSLGLLAKPDAPAPPRLVDLIHDVVVDVRQAAAEALGRYAPLDPQQVRLMLVAQRIDRQRRDDGEAPPVVALLARVDGLDAQAAQVLAEGWWNAGGDPTSDVADALVRSGPVGLRAVTAELARRRGAGKRVGRLLARFGDAAAPAAAILTRPTRDQREPGEEAIEALAAMGPAAKLAEPVLWEAFYDSESVEAAQALVAIGASGKEPMAFLIEEARRGRPDAIHALGLLGPRAKEALPVLWELVRQGETAQLFMRYEAALAVRRIDPSSEDPLPRLREELLVALRAPNARDVAGVRPLADAVENGAPSLRIDAARALGGMRGMAWEAWEALPALRAALAHPDSAVRDAAQQAIRSITEQR